ncbi:ATPase [Desulfuromonas versatilis]|uniref:ATPase n=1 Tax=Desulfuromonas versatilis TaxID=2802975 RepID=A0ABM8HTV7_9BACT|nr:ATP-binding protein [Desulfuromonas versatilis]BCR03910.1 ATPase [Desulfuromonas versatilis]
MAINSVDIDWGYVLERLDHLLDLGEEMLTRQLAEYQLPPEAFRGQHAFRWQKRGNGGYLEAIDHPDIPLLGDLLGLDRTLERLRQNTRQFVKGHPANNVLLWGERGTGKSSAVKGLLGEFGGEGLRLIEVHKEDLFQLPAITQQLRDLPYRFILFSDDLSFDESEVSYRELKALLEGGLEARPNNVLVYATSNRRHLMPERFADNTGEAEIHAEEAVSEKLSLSDRFGITIGFYPMNQDTYLAITRHLAKTRGLRISRRNLETQALQWALMRGARSGRVARQFVDDLHGRLALKGKVGPRGS